MVTRGPGRPVRRVLVTGGAGFVGSHVVDALVADGVEARVLDARDPAEDPTTHHHIAVERVVGDVRDRDLVERALTGVDAVCHQASMVGVEQGMQDAVTYASHNDVGTAALLAAMDAVGFSGRLVLASSMVVYGEGRYECGRHGRVRPHPRERAALEAGRFEHACPACDASLGPVAVPEDAPSDPRSVYAATKVHQEHLCRVFARERDAPLTILRYHNVYGPRMPANTTYAGVASIFRSALEAGSAPEVFEDGRQVRDFIHVRDVARANVLALTRERPVVGACNVATGQAHTIAEIAAALAAAFGPDAPSPRVTGAFRLGDVRHVLGSPERAARELGFTAQIGLAEGMRELSPASIAGSNA